MVNVMTMSRPFDTSLGPRLLGPMLIWLAVILAGGAAAIFATGDIGPVAKIAVALAIPALVSLVLMPVLHQAWTQIVLLGLWTGFAVIATMVGGIFPLGITFLCIPAIAMLFTRERVVEALVLAVLALAATWVSRDFFGEGASPLSETAIGLVAMLGTAGTLALIVATMISGTQTRDADVNMSAGGTFGAIAAGVVGGLLKFDADGRLTGANAEAHDQFDLNRVSEEIGLSQLAGGGEAGTQISEAAEMARQSGVAQIARIALPVSDRPDQTYDMTLTPQADGGLILHVLDRTADAARIEALRRTRTVAEREAHEKTLFFAGVSHELRTPLNAIIGFSDMMRSRLFGPLPSKYAEYADLIHDSGQYMLDLIGDVLDLSKVETGKYVLVPDTFDMTDVIRSSVKMIRPSADSADVRIELDLPEEDDMLITADRKAVRQILLNLLSNAVKFSPKGGRVDIGAQQDGGVTIITVSDQGPGMSEQELARIGEPFVQGKAAQNVEARGSGLGLSLVTQLAELHGGRFEVESKIDEGTTASVSLPSIET